MNVMFSAVLMFPENTELQNLWFAYRLTDNSMPEHILMQQFCEESRGAPRRS